MAITEKAVHGKARVFYDRLVELARTQDQPDTDSLVFTGNVSMVFHRLGISGNYYSAIRKLLIESGSVEILAVGRRNSPSVWRLAKPLPDALELEEIAARVLTPADDRVTLSGLDERVSRLEGWRETVGGLNIVDAFREMEKRLNALSKAIDQVSTNGKDG